MGVYLLNVHLTGVHLMIGEYLTGVYLMGGIPHRRVLYGRVLIFQIQKGLGGNL
jgi:hypothetical protein